MRWPTGSSCRDSLLEALVQHARIEKLVEVRGTSGVGAAGYRYILTRSGRDRATAVHGRLPLRRTGAGAAGAVQRTRAAPAWRHAADRPRPPRDRIRASHRQQGNVRQAGAGGQLRQAFFSMASPGTARPSSPRGSAARSARTCTFRTRSTSTARSSRCSIRSTTSARRFHRGNDERHRQCFLDQRWTRSAAGGCRRR